MLVLLVILFVVFLALSVLLWAGTLGVQGYIYSEPTPDLYWKAPAAGAALTVFLGLWCLLDYRAIDPVVPEIPYDTLFRFNPKDVHSVEEFVSVKVPPKVWYLRKKEGGAMEWEEDKAPEPEKTVYKREKSGSKTGSNDYLAAGKKWERADSFGVVEEIIVQDRGQELHFAPKLTEVQEEIEETRPGFGDKIKKRTRRKVFPPNAPEFPGYYQVRGSRSMVQIGQITDFRWGRFIVNLFLNVFHLGLWFVCLWLILRFQWGHALGGAIVIWLVMTLVVLPILLSRTQEAAQQRPTSALVVPWQTAKSA